MSGADAGQWANTSMFRSFRQLKKWSRSWWLEASGVGDKSAALPSAQVDCALGSAIASASCRMQQNRKNIKWRGQWRTAVTLGWKIPKLNGLAVCASAVQIEQSWSRILFFGGLIKVLNGWRKFSKLSWSTCLDQQMDGDFGSRSRQFGRCCCCCFAIAGGACIVVPILGNVKTGNTTANVRVLAQGKQWNIRCVGLGNKTESAASFAGEGSHLPSIQSARSLQYIKLSSVRRNHRCCQVLTMMLLLSFCKIP